jgi:ferric-dicitrate binding protein FerR (iron transport regulator)
MNPGIELLEEASRRFLAELDGNADPALERWLAIEPTHRLAYAQVCAAWYAAPAPVAALPDRRQRNAWALAAALTLLAVVCLWPGHRQMQEQVLIPGVTARLSSNVEMHSDADGRTLTLLHGRAWINADSSHSPAIAVHMASWRIVDIGTRFVVDADRRRIAVYAGAVDISRPGAVNSASVRLVAGEAFDLNRQQRIGLDALEIGLDNGQWILSGLSMAQASFEFEREGTRVWLLGHVGSELVPTMVLPDRNVAVALRQLCRELDLRCVDLGLLGFVIAH